MLSRRDVAEGRLIWLDYEGRVDVDVVCTCNAVQSLDSDFLNQSINQSRNTTY